MGGEGGVNTTNGDRFWRCDTCGEEYHVKVILNIEFSTAKDEEEAELL